MSLQENTALKKATLALLVQMMTSDAEIAPIEEKYIEYVSKELGISISGVDEIRANPDHFDLKPPQGEQDRMTILYYLLFTMRVDGKIEANEEELCYKAALKLGFNHQMVSDLIAVMKSSKGKDLPPDLLLKEIKKYMN
ncbi:MAG: hypothetical protein AAGG68_09250 [Bacteroidota bacterium]